ncbi:class I SAM-dependent methyltransferase [Mycolicibacterium novocastrense]|uniref:Class I SAM-dependent methyltransferase n=1 Tax=Mycolicibacterium novocastrense TaxID=59813 RepID=A0AAW5SLQ0_MYCNV|nr:class I SAM-dependent methyltransferase [Mycolicibacterium novocastrense]MCV7024421.1 class I SAM-dependent methyltransferase [Mycolicibacterium novocastrense]GAT12920.1 uncharacterized protein RMCN_6053 [Mycolicibacterium novocastrense]
MANSAPSANFEKLYSDKQTADGLPALTPWDIGEAQPAVKHLVACGAVNGEVLDPGTGPGHNAIYYASQGYSATGIDVSPSAIERAQLNAERAGVTVDFQVADATKLDGLEGRFDTVVDSAFYHVFGDSEDIQSAYAHALHRATRPGARLFMFEFGMHNVNGLPGMGLTAENFQRVLPSAGWRIDYLGTTTYKSHMSAKDLAAMGANAGNAGFAERLRPVHERLAVIEPMLENHVVHMPAWAVVATRID